MDTKTQNLNIPKPERKPGEIGFNLLAILFGVAGYYFAMDMTSGDLSSPSVAPKVASAIIIIMGIISLVKTLTQKQAIRTTASQLARYLFSRDVVVILTLLVAYSFLLPVLHFTLASFLFLLIALTYLQNFKRILLCLTISAGMMAALVTIFKYVFKVQLP